MSERVFLHVDLDAFFASVEQRDNPALKGRPVIVGADPQAGRGRGVVSTCSYEARRFGIHSAMPISLAFRKCPQGVFLPVSMTKYKNVSRQVFAIFQRFTPEVEGLGIDEAFLDVTESQGLFGPARRIALNIKEKIRLETGITASVGIAPNKMTAKIASDICKPDGLLEISAAGLQDFLRPLPVNRLWGVGPKTTQLLRERGVHTIGDLAGRPAEWMRELLGECGLDLHTLANGLDPRRVSLESETKSVSHEYTFDQDTFDREGIHHCLLELCEKVSRRLRQEGLSGRTLTLKVRLQGFQTFTRSFTFPFRTNHADILNKKARELLMEFLNRKKPIRLVGVKVSQFNGEYIEEDLFGDTKREKLEQVHRAMDAIQDKFGDRSIRRAG